MEVCYCAIMFYYLLIILLTNSFTVRACRTRITIALRPVHLVISRRATSLVVTALVTEVTGAAGKVRRGGGALASTAVVADTAEPGGFRQAIGLAVGPRGTLEAVSYCLATSRV